MIPHDVDAYKFYSSKSIQGITYHITTLVMVSALPLSVSVMRVYLPQQSKWNVWY